jgi:hypothetical protein
MPPRSCVQLFQHPYIFSTANRKLKTENLSFSDICSRCAVKISPDLVLSSYGDFSFILASRVFNSMILISSRPKNSGLPGPSHRATSETLSRRQREISEKLPKNYRKISAKYRFQKQTRSTITITWTPRKKVTEKTGKRKTANGHLLLFARIAFFSHSCKQKPQPSHNASSIVSGPSPVSGGCRAGQPK